MKLTGEKWAKIGITVQFLALVRTLAEYFRLKHIHGDRLSLSLIDPFITGALLAALLCWLAVALFFFRRYGIAALVSVVAVIVLLTYKLHTMGRK